VTAASRRGGAAGGARGGEFELLARVRRAVEALGRGRGVVVGIGDDCAVVEGIGAASSAGFGAAREQREGPRMSRSRRAGAAQQLLTTDTMLEGVHFRAAWLTPRELGVRAWRAAVSDIAAMGGAPLYALLSLELPTARPEFTPDAALALVRGLAAEAHRAGAALVGGNVSGGERWGVTVTVIGQTLAPRAILRSAVRRGDLVFVTGSLGGAAAGLRALLAAASSPGTARARGRGVPSGSRAARATASPSGPVDSAWSAAWRKPPLRLDVAAALAGSGQVHAMIDVSDGLLQDLGHLAQASGLALRLDPQAVPVHRIARRLEAAGGLSDRAAGTGIAPRRAPGGKTPVGGLTALDLALGGGEDYELAFTAPPRARPLLESIASRLRVPITVLGVAAEGRGEVTDGDGRPLAVAAAGFDHLRRPRASSTEGS